MIRYSRALYNVIHSPTKRNMLNYVRGRSALLKEKERRRTNKCTFNRGEYKNRNSTRCSLLQTGIKSV